MISNAIRAIALVVRAQSVTGGRADLLGILVTFSGTVGAGVAIFAVIYGLQFRPLPFDRPSGLYVVWHSYPGLGIEKERVSPPSLDLYRSFEGALADIAAVTPTSGVNLSLDANTPADPVTQVFVEPVLFRLLGVAPASGRLLADQDATPGNSSSVAVLSAGAWRRYFGRDIPNGQRLLLDGTSVEIVGVLPQTFQLLEGADVWRPLYLPPRLRDPSQLGNDYLTVFGRTRPNVGPSALSRSLDEISAEVRNTYPQVYPASEGWRLLAVPLRREIVGAIGGVVPLLWASLIALTVIGLVNVMNLVLVRTVSKRREVAVKVALGCGWPKLLVDHVAWILCLCLAGACIGLVLGHGLLRVTLETVLSKGQLMVPPWSLVKVDQSAVAFGFSLTSLCVLVCGLAASCAVSTKRFQRWDGNAHRMTIPRGVLVALRGLVAVQLAMTTILLVLSALLGVSVHRISNADPGFEMGDVSTFDLVLPRSRYASRDSRRALRAEFVDRLQSTPSVESAGVVSALPFLHAGAPTLVSLWGEEASGGSRPLQTSFLAASSGYFRTLRIPLLNGRIFDARDRSDTQAVVVVDRMAAEFFWPDRDPIGERLSFPFEVGDDGQPTWRTVVGVVGHVKTQTLQADSDFQLYVPMTQASPFQISFMVRLAPFAEGAARIIQTTLGDLDSQLPLHGLMSMEEVVRISYGPLRASAVVLIVFCATAIFLTMAGTYGIVSYFVTLSRKDLGVRIAHGASRTQILVHVLRPVVGLCIASAMIALPSTMIAASSIRSFLFDVSPLDPVVLGGAAILTSALALLASAMPAFAATTIPPAEVLRR